MCGGPDQTHTPHMGRPSPLKDNPTTNVKKEYAFGDALHPGSCLLEFAADDDLDKFQKCVKEGNGKVGDVVGVWYARSNSARQMVLEQRTPAMIASLYGSINVLTYILSQYPLQGGDVDHACGSDGSSALHCAAAGGSTQAIQAVKILIASGADINVRDIQGRRPADVIVVPHGCADSRLTLELLLGKDNPPVAYAEHDSSMLHQLKKCFVLSAFEDSRLSSAIDVSSIESSSSSSTLSTTSGASTLSLSPSASSSPKSPIALSNKGYVDDMEKAREGSVDQSLPDIKNTFYTSDEFRMYSFKIRPCSRAYSHDWTECPFAHPGENARRRDPRRYHYSCVPCPDFRKGACNQGDACEYAHGVFECWLHPAQYRTRLCKDGAECNRKVCFFAHKPEELRPVYAATGSGLPSPILSAFTDVSCMSPPLGPCSPSVLSPFSTLQPIQSTLQGSLRTPPLSPSSSLVNVPWPQPNIPTLHLPGASLQASRLRAALHARDVASNDDFDEQLVSDFQSPTAHSLSMQARLNAAVAASGTVASTPRSGRYKSLGLSLAPANLDELFASETHSSPGSRMRDVPLFARLDADKYPVASAASPQNRLRAYFQPSAVQCPGEAVCNLGSLPMHKVLDGEGHGAKAEVQGICKGSAVCNPGSLPMCKVFDGEGHGAKAEEHSICKGAASPGLIRARASLSNRQTGNWDFGAACAWSDWGSPTGKPEWGIQEEDLSNLRKSASLRMRGLEEPELLWRAEVTKGRNHDDAGVVPSKCIDSGTISIQQERADLSMVGTWIENMSLDEIVA